MGLFDRLKKTPPQSSSERLLPFKYEFECCGTAQAFVTQVPIMEDAHNTYMAMVDGVTGENRMAKLPVVLLRANEQGDSALEGLGDSVQELSSGLSKERLDELMLSAECQKCGRVFLHIMALAVVINEQGGALLIQRTDGSYHEGPLAILDYCIDGTEAFFELHSIL